MNYKNAKLYFIYMPTYSRFKIREWNTGEYNNYKSYSHEVKTQSYENYDEMMDKIDSIKRQNTLLMIGIAILAIAVFL